MYAEDAFFGTLFVLVIAAWITFMVFVCTGALDNNHTDPRTHRVEVSDTTYKVCAGPNLVYVSDTSFWGNNPRVMDTHLNSAECK